MLQPFGPVVRVRDVGDDLPRLQIGNLVYRIKRTDGALKATVFGPRGGLNYAVPQSRTKLIWWIWPASRQDTYLTWAIVNGPRSLRAIDEFMAADLFALEEEHPEHAQVILGYAAAGRQDAVDLSLEIVKTQGAGTLTAADLQATVDHLTLP